MKRFDFDVAVIGGGSGGYAAARTAAGAGLRTIVIEGGREVGGLCILRGCMPTKAMLYAAEVKHLAERAETWGVRAEKVTFNFTKVMARKAAQIKDFTDFRVQQLNAGKFKFIRANAKFIDAHTVELSNGKTLTANYFIIATGSSVAPSPLLQLDEVGYITSDDAVALKKSPKSLIILGGGAIACEFAQFFARFGVKVTLIQRGQHILKEFDADAALEIEKVFRREGVQVFTGTRLVDAGRKGKLKTVTFRAGWQNHFGCRRGNSVRAGSRAQYSFPRFGESWREGRSKWPHHHQCQDADEHAAYFRSGRLHWAA